MARSNFGQNVKFEFVGLITLFILFDIEDYISSVYGQFSTTGLLGFIVMGSITLWGLSYVIKSTHAEPAV